LDGVESGAITFDRMVVGTAARGEIIRKSWDPLLGSPAKILDRWIRKFN
jgi:hypothetical protein